MSSITVAPKGSNATAWLVWSVAALFYLYEMVLRVSPSVMTSELMQDFDISSSSLGFLTSFYYLSYALLQVPCGLVLDRYGVRNIVTVSALICVAGTYVFAVSETLYLAKIGRFLIGAGSACAFISCLKLCAEWFRPHRFAQMAVLTNLMGLLGNTMAESPLAFLVESVGWRNSLLILSAAGLGVAALCWFLIKEKPEHHGVDEESSYSNLMCSLKEVLKNRQILLAGIVGGLMYLPISAFGELWAVPYLKCVYNIDTEMAATANIMLVVGMGFGALLMEKLADTVRSYINVLRISSFVGVIMFALITMASKFPLEMIFLFLLVAGIFAGGQVLCFSWAKHSVSSKVSGTAAAFTNGTVMAIGFIFQPLLGCILDFFWDGKMTTSGEPLYTASNFQSAIMTLPLCLLVGLIVLFWGKSKYVHKHD